MRVWLSLCIEIYLAGLAFAQAGDPKPAFEVASVRRSTTKEVAGSMRGGPGSDDPGRITYLNLPLRTVLMRAFGLDSNKQLDGPDWINTARYDISANVPPGTTAEQFNRMLQNLLQDRLQMVIRRVTREGEAYRLNVARNGPKLKPSRPDAPPLPVPDGFPQPNAGGIGVGGGNGVYLLTARRKSTSFLIQLLTVQLQAEIDDQTGLDGVYDYNLGFVPARFLETNPDPRFTDLATALEDQLGLKLTPVKIPLQVVVVEKANAEPLEN